MKKKVKEVEQPMLISVRMLAERLDVCTKTIHRMRKAGEIGPVEIILGASIRYRTADVEKWMTEGCPSKAIFQGDK